MSREEVPDKGQAAPAPLAESPRSAEKILPAVRQSRRVRHQEVDTSFEHTKGFEKIREKSVTFRSLTTKGGRGGQAAVKDNTVCNQWSIFGNESKRGSPNESNLPTKVQKETTHQEETEKKRGQEQEEVSAHRKKRSAPKRDDTSDNRKKKISSNFVGHRILHMPEVETKLTDNLVCGPCVEEHLDSALARAIKEFGKFVDKQQAQSESKDKKAHQKVSESADAFISGEKGRKLKHDLKSQLYSPVKIEEATVGISTGLHVSCACHQIDHRYSNHHFEIEPVKAKKYFNKKKQWKRSAHMSNHWFEINNKFVMAVQATGGGGSDAQKILGIMDLPGSSTFASKFSSMETELGQTQRMVANQSMLDALNEEIKATIERHQDVYGMTYDEYTKMSLFDRPLVKLTVCFDMGWQKRSSGHRYDSLSGHAFLVGAYTKKVIACTVFSKVCSKCARAKKDMKDAIEHECPKNFDGSSKAMESEAILKMTKDAINHGYTIEFIVADDDSTMKSILRYSWDELISAGKMRKEDYPRYANGGKKKDYGRLPLNYLLPHFLADPGHRQKCVAKPIFALANASAAVSEATIVDALRIKKYWGYMIKQNRKKELEELVILSEAVVDHHFNCHDFCGDWCPVKKGKPVKEGKYRCKQKNKKLYQQIKDAVDKFRTPEKMKELLHEFDTQTNEGLNQAVAVLAPKSKTFCKTRALITRVEIAGAIHNMGYKRYWFTVYDKFEMNVPPLTRHLINRMESSKTKHQERAKAPAVKQHRVQSQNDKINKLFKDNKKAKAAGQDYGSGKGNNVDSGANEFTSSTTTSMTGKSRKKTQIKICSFCGTPGHTTRRSKKCLQNEANMNLPSAVGDVSAGLMAVEAPRLPRTGTGRSAIATDTGRLDLQLGAGESADMPLAELFCDQVPELARSTTATSVVTVESVPAQDFTIDPAEKIMRGTTFIGGIGDVVELSGSDVKVGLDNDDENSDSSSYVSHGVEFFDALGFDDDEDIDFDYSENEE
jgi:hypothetical protein